MNYIKLDLRISPFESWVSDVLMAQLGEIGFEAFAETPLGFEAFVREDQFSDEDVDLALEPYLENFRFEKSVEIVESRNWNEEWEKNYFKPLLIAGQCVVRAPFHAEYPEAQYEIVIEPNMAFGTGNHETTTMMLEYILETGIQGKKVLDMGCGTGILGILASMKGADKITAIDIDEWSYRGATENAALNHISNMQVFQGDASFIGSEKYHIILANIQRNVLLNDLPAYSSCLEAGGKIFMSGFYTQDLDAIKTRAESCGLKDIGFKTKNNWVACAFSG